MTDKQKTTIMAQFNFNGPMFTIRDNKNVTLDGEPITNEEAERILNNNQQSLQLWKLSSDM